MCYTIFRFKGAIMGGPKEIVSVEILPDYWLKLIFSHSEVRYFSCKAFVHPVDDSSPLNIYRDNMFQTVHLNRGALKWDNVLNVCADYVYMVSSRTIQED
jgi:hypothetical protein